MRMLGPAPSRVVRLAQLRAFFAKTGRLVVKKTKIKAKVRHTKRLINPLPTIKRFDYMHQKRYVQHKAAEMMARRIEGRKAKMMASGHDSDSISSIKVNVKPRSDRYYRAAKKTLKHSLMKIAAPAGAAYVGAAVYVPYKFGERRSKKGKPPSVTGTALGGIPYVMGYNKGQRRRGKRQLPVAGVLMGGPAYTAAYNKAQAKADRLRKVRRAK